MSVDGQRRAVVWRDESNETKLRLILNDLDELEATCERLEAGVKRRLNWLLGLFVGCLIALVVNLGILVVTR